MTSSSKFILDKDAAKGSSQTLLTDEKHLYLSLFQDSIRHFIGKDIPVNLEGFGILFPRIRNIDRSYQKDSHLIVRKEHFRTMEFEKCSSVTKFHRDTYRGLIGLREVAERICAFLPIELAITTTAKEIHYILATFVGELAHQVVYEGASSLLPVLGTFYALHNRQGSRFEDWFAGSDIFLHSHLSEPTSVGKCLLRERPILDSSWELLEAAYGPAIDKVSINLPQELKGLGYDVSAFPQDIKREIPVAVFQAYANKEKTHYLIYCTDGLRHQGLQMVGGRGFGTEMVIQLPITNPFDALDKKQLADIPRWPFRPLTMAWILLQSSRTRTLRSGLKMAEDSSLITHFDSDLSCIFTTQFDVVREEQLSTQGPFYFTNILGITRDEYALADKIGSEQLRIILEYKKLLQFTKPLRSSLTSRSSFEVPAATDRTHNILTDPRLSAVLEGSRSSVPA